jgi:hypothetical protein
MERGIKPGTLPFIQEGIMLCSVCYMTALYLRSLYRIGDLSMNEYEVLTANLSPDITASPVWTGLRLGLRDEMPATNILSTMHVS